MTCTHHVLRGLTPGGACPICPAAPIPERVPRRLPLDSRVARAQAELDRRKALRARAEQDRRKVARMRSSLAAFVRGAWPVKHGTKPLAWGPHLDVLCDHAQKMFEGWAGRHADGREGTPLHVQDLDVNACPGTLKSEIWLVFGPAWLWLLRPDASFGCVSGNPDNASRDARAHREIVSSAWYRDTFGIKWSIKPDQDQVGDWAITAGGKRQSQGLTAPATGWHVDILVIDDPDDWSTVHGEAKRAETKRKVEGLGNRLNSLEWSLRITVQQRVHYDDESARRAAAGVPRLEMPLHARVPAKPTPWYPAGEWEWRAAGEVLAPQFTAGVIAKERKRLGSAGVAAQYEQRPERAGSLFFPRDQFRWFRIEDTSAPPEGWTRPEGCSSSPAVVVKATRDKRKGTVEYDFDRVVVSIDATFGSMTSSASRIGALAIGVRGADRFVLDDLSRRGGLAVCEELIKTLVDRWGATKVLVEKKANGAAVMERLAGVVPGLVETEPQGGKESRANAMRPSVEGGNWYLLDGAPWVSDGHDDDDEGLLEEVAKFGSGRGKNDRVDCMSQLEAEERTYATPINDVTAEQWDAALAGIARSR